MPTSDPTPADPTPADSTTADPTPADAVRDWPGDWLRGVLTLCLLRVLADGPTYGYALGVRLAQAGLGELKGGTLYPALSRLEQAGHLTVEWRAGEGGPGRKYYALTASGRAALDDGAARWASFAALTATFVTGGPDDARSGRSGTTDGTTDGTTTVQHRAARTPAPTPGGPS